MEHSQACMLFFMAINIMLQAMCFFIEFSFQDISDMLQFQSLLLHIIKSFD